MSERLRLRAGFNNIADLYDRARPTYPAALFADLVRLTGLGPGSRLLEIGCGTGQASLSLAETGCELLAVELGAHLADIAGNRLQPYPAKVIVADFDRWTPDDADFDMIFSATAFHWLDPTTRYRRTAEMLARNGFLVTVHTGHVMGGTVAFYHDVESVYRRYDPTVSSRSRPVPADQLPLPPNPGLAPYYRTPINRRYEWEREYTTAEYLDLLRTYSVQIDMDRPAREGLLRDIGTLIDGRYGGRVTKRYLTLLRVAGVR